MWFSLTNCLVTRFRPTHYCLSAAILYKDETLTPALTIRATSTHTSHSLAYYAIYASSRFVALFAARHGPTWRGRRVLWSAR